MIVEIKTVSIDRKSPHARKTKRVIVYQCDHCKKHYEAGFRKDVLHLKRNYCSYACLGLSKKVGNVAYDDWIKSCNIPERIKRSRETFLQHHGVDHPFKCENVKAKIREKLIERFGVSHPMKSAEIRSRVNWKEISNKRHQTMKMNHSYNKSKKEDQFFEALIERFGKDNVDRCVIVNNWEIDFYIRSIDVYVQFDGVYWHGLGRDKNEITEESTQRQKVIHQTWLRDQEQIIWFKENEKSLIRITDKQFSQDASLCLTNIGGLT